MLILSLILGAAAVAALAMVATHTITTTYTTPGGSLVTTQQTADQGEGNYDFAIPDNSTNLEFDVTLTPTQIQCGCLYFATPGTAGISCGVKVNSTGATAIPLTSNIGLVWLTTAQATAAAPSGLGSAGITKIYVTSGATAGTLSIRTVLHPGP